MSPTSPRCDNLCAAMTSQCGVESEDGVRSDGWVGMVVLPPSLWPPQSGARSGGGSCKPPPCKSSQLQDHFEPRRIRRILDVDMLIYRIELCVSHTAGWHVALLGVDQSVANEARRRAWAGPAGT